MNNFLRTLLGMSRDDDQEIGTIGHENSISWEPEPPRVDDTVNIHYHGSLKDSGANEIFLHYGFDSWNQSVNTVKMEKTEQGNFSAAVKTEKAHEMNFCFKDDANNWDNNNGYNWNISLHKSHLSTKTPSSGFDEKG